MYYCVPWVEACALVTMCSYRSVTRRLSLVLLKEIRSLHAALQIQVRTCTYMWMYIHTEDMYIHVDVRTVPQIQVRTCT